MVIVNKGLVQNINLTLNGPNRSTTTGFKLIEFIPDVEMVNAPGAPIGTTGPGYPVSQFVVPVETIKSERWKYEGAYTEGVDLWPTSLILTGTLRHYKYNCWLVPTATYPYPVINDPKYTEVPVGSELLETGKVWVQGVDTNPINEIYL